MSNTKKKVLILGGGGIASIASWIMDRRGDAEAIGLINDFVPIGEYIGKKKKLEVLGNSNDVGKYIRDTDVSFFVAFHGMQKERIVYQKILDLGIPDDRLYSPIDPSAAIAWDYSEIGPGVLVGPYAQIGPDVSIGRNAVILGNAFVGHDSCVGEFCHIATNAVIGSNINIGNACHIGMNATVREFVNIKDYCLVGMGSTVLNDIDEDSIVVGNPAKLLRKKSEG